MLNYIPIANFFLLLTRITLYGYAIIYLLTDRLLGDFHVENLCPYKDLNIKLLKMCAQVFVWVCVFISPRLIPRSRMAITYESLYA